MVEPANLNDHHTGDTVTFHCSDGYILTGDLSAMCSYKPGDNMGSWNKEQPTCLG